MVWYRDNKKQTTGDLLQLSVGWLKKHKYLQENAIINGGLNWKRIYAGGDSREVASVVLKSNFIGENRSITLAYTYKGEEQIRLDIAIVCTTPHYGGKRYWFLCPNCGKRVAFLYGNKYFWCRHCQHLSYPTQQMGFINRMLERSRKYQDRVLVNGLKRRWLHQKTMERYLDEADYCETQGMIAMYKIINKRQQREKCIMDT